MSYSCVATVASIECHVRKRARVQESIAAGVLTFAHILSTENIANIMTKPLPNQKFHKLVKPVLFRAPVHVQPKLEPVQESN